MTAVDEWRPCRNPADAQARLQALAAILGRAVATDVLDLTMADHYVDAAAEVMRADLILAGADPRPARYSWAVALNAQWALRDTVRIVKAEINAQLWEARRAIGPALARGLAPDAVRRIAGGVAPGAPLEDLRAVLAEETAWWLRWRHDRGMRDQIAEGEG